MPISNTKRSPPGSAARLTSKNRERRHPHERWTSTNGREAQRAWICSALGHLPHHALAHFHDGARAEHPDRRPARKRKRDDLAREAIHPRREALLPQDGAVSDFPRRPHQAEVGFHPLHAPGLQRPHEQRRRLVEVYLCRGRGSVDRKPQAAPKSPASPGRRNRHSRECTEWTRHSRATRGAWSTRRNWSAQRRRAAGPERDAARRINLWPKSSPTVGNPI